MRPHRILAVGAAASLLAGCISVLPKEAPEQLYRFGGGAAAQAASPPTTRFAVQSGVASFERAATGDRILTVTGDQAAYLTGGRWVIAAPALFEAAVTQAFDADQGAARLIARGENVRPDYFLKLDVRTFETQYVHGAGAPPTVVVSVYAALSRQNDRSLAGERTFTASVPATENRIGAIVAAYGQAVAQSLGAMVKWVDAKGVG
jgi:cholesterol transport system auxiliary component